MSTVAASTGLRAIALTDIQLSRTGSQAERRKHFDKAAMAELAGSIKAHGVLVPVIARPVNGHFELVAGERRYLAAKQAGIAAINADVRTLTDEQVLEIQLIENLQREGLHELAEAEGYEQLVKFGHSAEQVADKVGKSKAYVYARMKLLALSKGCRAAFYDGKLTASTALLIARIPVESVQLEALKEITAKRYLDQSMSYREAADLIHRDYMTNLSEAGFPTQDAQLVPAAGPCGACPKRTGNQPELFGDVKSGDVCTDPVCFRAKRDAFAARAIAAAKQSGETVLTGKAAKDVMPFSSGGLARGWSKLTDKCYEDPKYRTAAQILGKDFKPTLIQDPETGALVKAAPPGAIAAALKNQGVKQSSSPRNPQTAAEKKAKLEKKFHIALYSEMRDKFPKKLSDDDLRTVALRFFDEMQQDDQKSVLALWQWEPVKGKYNIDCRAAASKGLGDLLDSQLALFFFDLVFVKYLSVHTWSSEPPTLLLKAAKKLKINPEKIRRQINAATPKTKKAKGKK
jgi:ParB/RepB/Spo0J family partition protein